MKQKPGKILKRKVSSGHSLGRPLGEVYTFQTGPLSCLIFVRWRRSLYPEGGPCRWDGYFMKAHPKPTAVRIGNHPCIVLNASTVEGFYYNRLIGMFKHKIGGWKGYVPRTTFLGWT